MLSFEMEGSWSSTQFHQDRVAAKVEGLLGVAMEPAAVVAAARTVERSALALVVIVRALGAVCSARVWVVL